MATWSDYGLPAFQTPGYRYSVDAGLLRTPFDTARPRQKRAYATNPHKYSVSVWVTQEQLTVAEWFLTNFGYSWFTADLTDEAGSAVPHFVRVTADYGVTVKGFNTYEMRFELESYVEVQEIPQWVTSRIYPLYVLDEMTAGNAVGSSAPPTAPKSTLEAYDRLTTHRPLATVVPPSDPTAGTNEVYDSELSVTPPDTPTAS